MLHTSPTAATRARFQLFDRHGNIAFWSYIPEAAEGFRQARITDLLDLLDYHKLMLRRALAEAQRHDHKRRAGIINHYRRRIVDVSHQIKHFKATEIVAS